jgi:putative ABC transport system permease protein
LKLGQKIVLSHGHTEDGDGFEKHEEHPFSIAGILRTTGTPVDKSVYVSLVGMAEIHRDLITQEKTTHEEHASEKEHDHDDDEDQAQGHSDDHGHDHENSSFETSDGKIAVTAVSGFFLGARNRMESLNLQRTLNTWQGDALLAVLPGMAMAELWKNLAIFENALSIVSFSVVIAGILGLFVSLYIISGQRQREMMVLRAVGAGPMTIFSLLAGEAIFLVLAGIGVGAGVMYGGLTLLAPWIEKRFSVTLFLSGPSTDDFIFASSMLVVGCIVGIVASFNAYRSAMHDGLGTRF